jgi:hypothetical protein
LVSYELENLGNPLGAGKNFQRVSWKFLTFWKELETFGTGMSWKLREELEALSMVGAENDSPSF